MSVLTDDVDRMGMDKLVPGVHSGDAVRAMVGVAMARMTTADCPGVASLSSGLAARNKELWNCREKDDRC